MSRSRVSLRALPSRFQQDKDRYRSLYGPLAAYVPELVAMRAGLRTATQVSLDETPGPSTEQALRRFCDRVGFHLAFRRTRRKRMCLISLRPLAPIADGPDAANMGMVLGYPKCCMETYLREGVGWDYARRMGALLAGRATMDFRLNPFLRTTPFHLFKHFPCRADCPATLKLADRLLQAIRQMAPELGRLVEDYNRLPVLFTGIRGAAISLAAPAMIDDTLEYSGFFYDVNPSAQPMGPARERSAGMADQALFDGIVKALSRGTSLRRDSADGLLVYSGPRLVERVSLPRRYRWRLVSYTNDLCAPAEGD